MSRYGSAIRPAASRSVCALPGTVARTVRPAISGGTGPATACRVQPVIGSRAGSVVPGTWVAAGIGRSSLGDSRLNGRIDPRWVDRMPARRHRAVARSEPPSPVSHVSLGSARLAHRSERNVLERRPSGRPVAWTVVATDFPTEISALRSTLGTIRAVSDPDALRARIGHGADGAERAA